jgi:hypothetical protein
MQQQMCADICHSRRLVQSFPHVEEITGTQEIVPTTPAGGRPKHNDIGWGIGAGHGNVPPQMQ